MFLTFLFQIMKKNYTEYYFLRETIHIDVVSFCFQHIHTYITITYSGTQDNFFCIYRIYLYFNIILNGFFYNSVLLVYKAKQMEINFGKCEYELVGNWMFLVFSLILPEIFSTSLFCTHNSPKKIKFRFLLEQKKHFDPGEKIKTKLQMRTKIFPHCFHIFQDVCRKILGNFIWPGAH